MLRKKHAAETELEQEAETMYTMLFSSKITIKDRTYKYDPKR